MSYLAPLMRWSEIGHTETDRESYAKRVGQTRSCGGRKRKGAPVFTIRAPFITGNLVYLTGVTTTLPS